MDPPEPSIGRVLVEVCSMFSFTCVAGIFWTSYGDTCSEQHSSNAVPETMMVVRDEAGS